MGEVINLPTARAAAPEVIQHPQANAYGFEPLEHVPERARVDVTGCMDGWRVWLLERPYRDFARLIDASRCAAALMTLDALDALPGAGPTPKPAA